MKGTGFIPHWQTIMNKILIDEQSWSTLNQWVVENPGAVKASWSRAYFKDMEIRYTNTETVAYVEKKQDSWVARVKLHGLTRMKVIIDKLKDYEHDFRIWYKLINKTAKDTDLQDLDECNKMAQFISASVLYINAYLFYGNAYEDRPVILLGKNDGTKKVIVFRIFDGKTYAVATTTHRSPQGIFSVRGHFRRYKNGHVIWIDEYLKGIDKEV